MKLSLVLLGGKRMLRSLKGGLKSCGSGLVCCEVCMK